MQLQTILNRVEHYRSFVFRRVTWDEKAARLTLRVELEHRANGRPVCSGCGEVRPGYDRLPERTWEFVPLWQIAVLFVYALRRVDCPECGVVAERVPWSEGKQRQTKTYRWFLARWAQRLSWLETANIFHTSWDTVYRSVRYAVLWGVVRVDVSGVEALGIDEIQSKRQTEPLLARGVGSEVVFLEPLRTEYPYGTQDRCRGVRGVAKAMGAV